MTVQSTRSISDLQTADGENRLWDFGFKISNAAHAVLIVYDADDVPTEYTGEDIIVEGVGVDAGGTVEFPISPATALPVGYRCVVLRRQQFEQPDRIGNQGRFFPKIHEDAFDRLTQIVQEIRDFGIITSIRMPPGDGEPGVFDMVLPLAEARANNVFEFDETGKPIANRSISSTLDLAEGYKDDAQLAAEEAEGFSDEAETAATAASGSNTSAGNWATRASQWAELLGALVAATGYSAKEWAIGTFTRGAAGGGSAKDWATYTGGTVDDTGHSAKWWAAIAEGFAAVLNPANYATAAQGAKADSAVQPAALAAYAPLANPALSGNPTAPTQAANDNSTKIATTEYADRAGALVLLATLTASNSASLQDTTHITNAYDSYLIEFQDIVPSVNGNALMMQLTANAGGAWKTASYQNAAQTSTDTVALSAITNAMVVGGFDADNAINSTASYGCSGSFVFSNPNSANYKKSYGNWFCTPAGFGGAIQAVAGSFGSLYMGDTNAINGVRFIMSANNILTGVIRIYGIKK